MTLTLPDDFLGKQVEIIAFVVEEAIRESKKKHLLPFWMYPTSLKQVTNLIETKPMNANKAFLDTNLLIYAHTNLDVIKQQKVQQVINASPLCILPDKAPCP